jgi:hypothetical protein
MFVGDFIDIQSVHDGVEVDHRDCSVEVDSFHDGVHVNPVDGRVEVDGGDNAVDVDCLDDGIDIATASRSTLCRITSVRSTSASAASTIRVSRGRTSDWIKYPMDSGWLADVRGGE